ncbi:unnamed protein product, partial [Didymodactylos carnosus]
KLRKAVAKNKEKLNQIKTWTSKLNTEDGKRRVEEIRKVEQQKVERRKYDIGELLKTVKAQSTIDICFLMDCTGSMTAYIEATKTNIHHTTQTITSLFKPPQLAFVGYRDVNDVQNCVKLDFTNDVNVFKEFLKDVQATGGKDSCEDIFSE